MKKKLYDYKHFKSSKFKALSAEGLRALLTPTFEQ